MRQQFSDGVDKLQPLHVGSPRVVTHENLLKLIVFSSIYSNNKKGPFLLGHSVTVVRNAYSSSNSSSSRLLTHQLRSDGESAAANSSPSEKWVIAMHATERTYCRQRQSISEHSDPDLSSMAYRAIFDRSYMSHSINVSGESEISPFPDPVHREYE